MERYAIVESGARQYLVKENDLIHVEKVAVSSGEVSLDKVLLLKNNNDVKVGNPFISGAKVQCEVIEEERQPKVINYKFRRRKNSRRKKGHRQTLAVLKVKSIEG